MNYQQQKIEEINDTFQETIMFSNKTYFIEESIKMKEENYKLREKLEILEKSLRLLNKESKKIKLNESSKESNNQ